jgi:hypothetical protein
VSSRHSLSIRTTGSTTPSSEYMAERYPTLNEEGLVELRRLGERYCQPVIRHGPPVGATT